MQSYLKDPDLRGLVVLLQAAFGAGLVWMVGREIFEGRGGDLDFGAVFLTVIFVALAVFAPLRQCPACRQPFMIPYWSEKSCEGCQTKSDEAVRHLAALEQARVQARARVCEEAERARAAAEIASRLKERQGWTNLSPTQFEEQVAEVFRRQGFEARLTATSNDEGIDIKLRRTGKKYVAQCKRYSGPVGRPVLQQFYGALVHEAVAGGYFVTTGAFTQAAVAFARGKPIVLIDLDRLLAASRGQFTLWPVRLSRS